MSFFQTGTRVLKIIDYILFRLFPGFIFLYSYAKISNSIDATLRASNSHFLIPFTLLWFLTFVNMLVWVLAGEAVYNERTKSGVIHETNIISFFKHFLGLLVSFFCALYFSGSENIFHTLLLSGAVFTLGTFLLEFSIVIPKLFKKSVNQEAQSHQNNIFLGIFAICFYILPLLWVASLLGEPKYIVLNIFFLFLSRLEISVWRKEKSET